MIKNALTAIKITKTFLILGPICLSFFGSGKHVLYY